MKSAGPVLIKERPTTTTNTAQLTAVSTAALKSVPVASKRKERYNDALIRNAAKRAAIALGPLVEEIHGLIRAASGPDELKRRLVALYRDSSAAELGKIFERTNVLANLAGRHDLLLEL